MTRVNRLQLRDMQPSVRKRRCSFKAGVPLLRQNFCFWESNESWLLAIIHENQLLRHHIREAVTQLEAGDNTAEDVDEDFVDHDAQDRTAAVEELQSAIAGVASQAGGAAADGSHPPTAPSGSVGYATGSLPEKFHFTESQKQATFLALVQHAPDGSRGNAATNALSLVREPSLFQQKKFQPVGQALPVASYANRFVDILGNVMPHPTKQLYLSEFTPGEVTMHQAALQVAMGLQELVVAKFGDMPQNDAEYKEAHCRLLAKHIGVAVTPAQLACDSVTTTLMVSPDVDIDALVRRFVHTLSSEDECMKHLLAARNGYVARNGTARQQLEAAVRKGLQQQLDEVAPHKDDQNRTDHGYNRDAAYVDGDFAGTVIMKVQMTKDTVAEVPTERGSYYMIPSLQAKTHWIEAGQLQDNGFRIAVITAGRAGCKVYQKKVRTQLATLQIPGLKMNLSVEVANVLLEPSGMSVPDLQMFGVTQAILSRPNALQLDAPPEMGVRYIDAHADKRWMLSTLEKAVRQLLLPQAWVNDTIVPSYHPSVVTLWLLSSHFNGQEKFIAACGALRERFAQEPLAPQDIVQAFSGVCLGELQGGSSARTCPTQSTKNLAALEVAISGENGLLQQVTDMLSKVNIADTTNGTLTVGYEALIVFLQENVAGVGSFAACSMPCLALFFGLIDPTNPALVIEFGESCRLFEGSAFRHLLAFWNLPCNTDTLLELSNKMGRCAHMVDNMGCETGRWLHKKSKTKLDVMYDEFPMLSTIRDGAVVQVARPKQLPPHLFRDGDGVLQLAHAVRAQAIAQVVQVQQALLPATDATTATPLLKDKQGKAPPTGTVIKRIAVGQPGAAPHAKRGAVAVLDSDTCRA